MQRQCKLRLELLLIASAYIVFKLLGCLVDIEYRFASGIIDIVIKTADFIYGFEFKRNGTAEEALRQIEERNYAIPFKADGRKLIKIGANFSDKLRGLENWTISH